MGGGGAAPAPPLRPVRLCNAEFGNFGGEDSRSSKKDLLHFRAKISVSRVVLANDHILLTYLSSDNCQ